MGDVIEKDDTVATANSRDKGRVQISMSGDKVVRVRVDLTGWGYTATADEEDILTITFGNVTAPARRADYPFQTSSKASGGRFTRLAKVDPSVLLGTGSPTVTTNDDVYADVVNVSNVASGVGSIAITKTGTSDDLSSVFAGDTARITFTFTATGSMNAYGGEDDNETDSTITIALPTGFPDLDVNNPAVENDSFNVQVSGKNSAVVLGDGNGAEDVVQALTEGTGNSVVIHIARMEAGQSVSIAYEAAIPAGTAAAVDGFDVLTNTGSGADNGAEASIGIDADDVNQLDDDLQIKLKDGSGTLEVTPVSVKQGFEDQTFEIVYTAATENGDAKTQLRITVPPELDLKGSVVSGIPSGFVDGAARAENVIIWKNLPVIKAGKTFKTTITKVNPVDAEHVGALSWEWSTHIATVDADFVDTDDPIDVGSAIFDNDGELVTTYVVKSEPDDVTFEIVESGVAVLTPTYNANSKEQTIIFRFTAVNTPLSEGSVGFSLPSGWNTFTKETGDDDTGKVSVTSSVLPVEEGPDADDITLLGGRKITVKVESLAQGEHIDIKYANVAMPADSTDDPNRNKEDEINGFFVVSKAVPKSQDTDPIKVVIGNVEDGSGTATIGAPGRRDHDVRAGSKDNTIQIKYTAEGTMKGGAVRLIIPEAWGEMQLDPLKRNYLQVRSNRSVTVDLAGDSSPDQGDDQSRVVVVEIGDRFEKGDYIQFDYGAGTGSKENRGAEASSTIDIATFTIESARDSSYDFALLKGEEATAVEKNVTNKDLLGKIYEDNPGHLRLAVKGAGDGSGAGTFEIAGSKAGETDYLDAEGDTVNEFRLHAGDGETAYIQFIYTADQTIKDGELKFILPSTGDWTDPQNESPRLPGYTYPTTSGTAALDDTKTTYANGSVTVTISNISEDETITVHYGVDGGGAEVPTEVDDYSFVIQTKGTDTNARFRLFLR